MPECRRILFPGGEIPLDRTRIVGIVNCTPDSFYPGSRTPGVDDAVARGLEMEQQGADLLDVGGESTRPGSPRIGEEEETARLLPVIERLAGRVHIPISVDTYKARVAARALDAGAVMINDVTALRGDPAMAPLVGKRKAAVVLMHALWPPATMQESPEYVDVVEDVASFLETRARYARAHGVPEESVIVDPGIGFGKTLRNNLDLLRDVPRLLALGYPLLVGPSRKGFIGELTGRPSEGRLAGTLAVVALCAASGAHFVRVHDVAEARDATRLVDAVVWQV